MEATSRTVATSGIHVLRIDIPPQRLRSRGEALFFGKAQCASCHVPPTYMDQQMHDLRIERFLKEAPDGPIKTFTLRGIKESPPYLHDGRCLTLEDTVEFFNIVLQLKLTSEEKSDLVAFMRVL